MKTLKLIPLFVFLLVSVAHAEWCPEYFGSTPDMAVHLPHSYSLYYFSDGIQYGESNKISGTVVLTKDQYVYNIDYTARGQNDWFTSIYLEGELAAFSCDSASFTFEGANLVDEEGSSRQFWRGQCKSKLRDLNCDWNDPIWSI